MSSYVILWPNGDSSVISASTGLELYDNLDCEGDPGSCLIVPITPTCHIQITRECLPGKDGKENTSKPRRMCFSVEGESSFKPKFCTFVEGMFATWMNAMNRTTSPKSPKHSLKALSKAEVGKFFKDNSDSWANAWEDEAELEDEIEPKAEVPLVTT